MKFDILSIVFLVVIALFIIFGLKRGFFKSLISLIKNFAALLIAAFLCRPLASLLNNSKLGLLLSDKISSLFTGDVFNITLSEENMDTVVKQAFLNINLPEKLCDYLASMLSKIIQISEESITVGQAIGKTLSLYVFMAIVFIVLFIVARILIRLLDKLFETLEEIPFVGFVNKLLGAVLNGFIGVLLVCFVAYIFTLIIPLNNGLSQWLVTTMYLDNADVFTFSKFIYENNIFLSIISFIQKLFA